MPAGDLIKDFMNRLHGQRIARGDRRRKEQALLPPDLTGHVFSACRQEAERIREWMAKVEAEVTSVEAALDAGEKEARAKCRNLTIPGKRKGDILAGFEVVPPQEDPLRWQKTPEALAYQREKVQPLRRRLQALRREITRREQELHQLRRIAEKAAAGDVALVHFLSDHWRARLEIGPGTEGTLARLISYHAVPADAAGSELPDEAFNEDGKPDTPPRGRMPGRLTA